MREFEFEVCAIGWKLDDVRTALNKHRDSRGANKTAVVFDMVVPHPGGQYQLSPDRFGILIALLCRDMTSRPYRRFPNA